MNNRAANEPFPKNMEMAANRLENGRAAYQKGLPRESEDDFWLKGWDDERRKSDAREGPAPSV